MNPTPYPIEIQLTHNGPWFLCLVYADPKPNTDTQVYRDGAFRKVNIHAIRKPQLDN